MEKFSDWKIFPIKNPKIKANGSVIVAGTISIKFSIFEGSKGLFAMVPSNKYVDKEGTTKYSKYYTFPDKEVDLEFQKLAVLNYHKSQGNENAGEYDQTKISSDPEDQVEKKGFNDGIPF